MKTFSDHTTAKQQVKAVPLIRWSSAFFPVAITEAARAAAQNFAETRLKRATGGKDAALTGTLGSVPLHVEAAILAAGDDGFQPSGIGFYKVNCIPPYRRIAFGKASISPRMRAAINPRFRRSAFTLIEIMVVMALLSVIVLGLMAMFSQVQRAFRAGMAQTDQMEGGRMFSDMLVRDLQQMTPSQQSNGINFNVQIPNYAPLQQVMPASTIPRTNILDDVFFVSRNNQTWNGIGYFVRTNGGLGGGVDLAGTLYRYETNFSMAQFQANPGLPYQTFLVATNPPMINISKILDGVVEFRVRAYDPTNQWITAGQTNIGTFNSYPTYGEVGTLSFSNNAVPAYLEIEVGILEPAVWTKYNSIPDPVARSNFLANHAGNVQLFRQRLAIRNVDPSAY